MSDLCVRPNTCYFFLRCSCMIEVVIFSPEIIIMVKKCRNSQDSECYLKLRREICRDCQWQSNYGYDMPYCYKQGKKVLGSIHSTPEKILCHDFRRKGPVFKFFSVHTKLKSPQRFCVFEKALFSWRISVDGTLIITPQTVQLVVFVDFIVCWNQLLKLIFLIVVRIKWFP